MRRLAPDVMDVPAAQAWLEDWAAKGWYLEKYGTYLARFVPGEKREEVRYRLQPVKDGEEAPAQDMQTDYQEMGWTYVCSTTNGMVTEFHVWRCDDPAVPELETEQSLREGEYGELLRRGWRDIWIAAFMAILILALAAWMVWSRPRQFVLGSYPSSNLLVLCCNGLLLIRLLSRSLRLIRFTRRLRSEEPAPQRTPWCWARARTGLFAGLYLLVLLAMTGGLFLRRDSRPFLPVSQWEEPVPYVSLSELGTPAAEEAEAVDFHSVWAKSAWWTLEGDYEETPRCESEYYSLHFPSMAVHLEQQLIEWRGLVPKGIETLPAPPGVDSVRWWKSSGNEAWQLLVIRQGGQVLQVVYQGEADLRDHLDSYADMLRTFQQRGK